MSVGWVERASIDGRSIELGEPELQLVRHESLVDPRRQVRHVGRHYEMST